MNIKNVDKKFLIFAILSSAFFIFSMVNNLMHSPLWGDEWIEYSISQLPLVAKDFTLAGKPEGIRGIYRLFPLFHSCGNTFQPPLYNVIMHFYLKISNDLLWFRLFNVFLSVITGVYLFKTLKLIANKWFGLVGLAFISVFYWWIYTVQECSEYCLMLFFQVMSIYFFTKLFLDFNDNKELNFKYVILFITSCTCAIYSQYGAVFLCIPLLIIFFIKVATTCDKKTTFKILKTYILYFIFLALPLLLIYVRAQFKGNKIIENSNLLDITYITDLFTTFGSLIGFLILGSLKYNLFFIILGLTIIVNSIYMLVSKNTPYIKKIILIILFITYILSYTLIKMHIYAVAANSSYAGFYSRYSTFYIPIAILFILINIHELLSHKVLKFLSFAMIVFLTAASVFSYKIILRNWEKTADFEMLKIYVDHEGYKKPTVLLGNSRSFGFGFYVKNYYDGKIETYTDIDTTLDEFYIYAVDWISESRSKIDDLIRNSESLGYKYIEYYARDTYNMLYYFYRE